MHPWNEQPQSCLSLEEIKRVFSHIMVGAGNKICALYRLPAEH